MDLKQFMIDYAQEIDGQFSEYDDNKSVIIVPLPDKRYQTVVGEEKKIGPNDRLGAEFSSKICPYRKDINLKDLLEENTKFCHAKLSIVNDFLQVEASAFLDSITDDVLKEIVLEVANTADDWEFKLTGQDVH
ncbi:MAG: hypothetical protein AAF363_02650 [Bacteroidota bacterium]